MAILSSLLLALSLRAVYDKSWLDRAATTFNRFLLLEDRLAEVTLSLGFGVVVSTIFLAACSTRLGHYLAPLAQMAIAVLPLYLWLVFSGGLALATLLTSFPTIFAGEKSLLSVTRVRWVEILVISSAGLFHLLTLGFQIRIFKSLPGWFWKFHTKPFTTRDTLFAALVLATLLAIWVLAKHPGRSRLAMTMLITAGLAWQIGFGFIEGGGFESLRQKFTDSQHFRYAEHASDNPDLLYSLLHYNELYGKDQFLGTKPPGVLLAYMLTQKASNLVHPAADFQGQVLRLTSFAAVVFPFLSFLVLIPLTLLARQLIEPNKAWIAGAIFISLPNVVLIPLFLDQVLYPLLFTVCIGLVWLGISRRSAAWMAAAGLACAIAATYMSFSLLPVIPLALAWIVLDSWRNPDGTHWKKSLLLFFSLAAGLLAGILALRLSLNYDVISRYTQALEVHRSAKNFQGDIYNLFISSVVNNLDSASWVGFPAALLAAIGVVRAAVRTARRKGEALDVLGAALAVTFVVLNLTGQTRGEVGRLWLFLAPLTALFATAELRYIFARLRGGLIFVLGLQWLTILFTFHFQDFFA